MTDQEINEAVMRKLGWKLGYSDPYTYWIDPTGHATTYRWDMFVDYCHDIEAAFEIVDYLRSKTDYFYFTLMSTSGMTGLLWRATFSEFNPPFSDDLIGESNSPMGAICLAFLSLKNKARGEIA